ncbi:MAG: hypothetical protein JWR36_2045, partial [Glaciihabitans sp.]|nr:hypothetical protein [Glaciihabitans sp.]
RRGGAGERLLYGVLGELKAARESNYGGEDARPLTPKRRLERVSGHVSIKAAAV